MRINIHTTSNGFTVQLSECGGGGYNDPFYSFESKRSLLKALPRLVDQMRRENEASRIAAEAKRALKKED